MVLGGLRSFHVLVTTEECLLWLNFYQFGFLSSCFSSR